MIGSRLSCLLHGAVLLLTGCIEASDRAAAGRERTEIDNADVPHWEIQLLTRVGSVDGPEDALGRVGPVLIAPDTTLIISQPRDASLLVFDQRGKFVRQIGRRGEGPGELEGISGVGFLGDTLYVSDPAQDRVNYFTLNGDVIRSRRWFTETFRVSDSYFFTPTPPQVLIEDGTALVQPGMGLTPTTAMGPGVNTALYRTPYLHVDDSSQVIDTAAWRVAEGVSVGVTKGGETYFYGSPFSAPPLVRMMPDGTGVVLVERDQRGAGDSTFRVVKVGPEGDTTFARAFEYPPIPTPEVFIDQTFQELAAFQRERDSSAPTAAEVRRAFDDVGLIPEQLVPVTGLGVGQDGSIWLRREDDLSGAMVVWIRLESSDARPDGSVRLPTDDVVADGYGDLIAVLGSGEFDVPEVSLYRLSR